jgi:hypothetical protein
MKLIYSITAMLFITACSNNTAENVESPAEPKTENPVVQEEIKKSDADLLIGTWVFDDPKIKVTQIITYKDDGTYSMKMGEMNIAGTWELNDNILITKSRPDAPGQNKTITNIDEHSLTVFWEPPGGKGRELIYKRQ